MMEHLTINHKVDYYDEFDPRLISTLYLRHIYTRVHEFKFNFLGMITGKHRTGKSMTALNFAHMLDKTFEENLEERVVYFANDFMTALNKIKQKNIIGGAVVWDEAGVGIPSREWYDISNRSISMALQVFGRYRPIVFFVTPDVSFIDSQARKLFHGFYEMTRVDNKNAIARCFDVQYNKRSTKVFYHYSRFHIKKEGAFGINLKMKRLKIFPPPAELEVRYDVHSKVFKDMIMRQMGERTTKFKEGSLDAKKMTYEEIVATLVERKTDKRFLSKRSTEDNILFDANAIRFEFDVPAGLAAHVKRKAEIQVNKVPGSEQIKEE